MRASITNRRHRACRGQTLVESAVSVLLFGGVAGLACAVARDTSGAVSTQFGASLARRSVADASRELLDELADANGATLVIDAPQPLGSILDFEVPLDDANGVVTWGARSQGEEGTTSHPGGRVRWFVEADPRGGAAPRLMRQVTDAQGSVVEAATPIIAALAVPDPVAGAGFVATRVGNLVTLQIRIRRAHGADDPDAAHALVLRLRNGG